MKKYLYNGVPLPGLPEWDKVNNPCAAIMRIEVDGTAHALLAVAQYADSRFAIRNNKNGDPVVMAKISGYYVGINSFNCVAMFHAPLSGGEWVATADSFSCNAEDLIWSNFDVADARTDEGIVYLAASEPVPILAPVIDPLSMWLGYQAGQWVVKQRGKKKTPVAYVYPQLVLPDIDAVWTDKETYPYAVIYQSSSTGVYHLRLCSGYVTVVSTGWLASSGTNLQYKLESGEWLFTKEGTTFSNLAASPLWTNDDIYTGSNHTGTLKYSAYTPVPAGNGMAVYKCVRLPGLPEWDKTVYPYAFVEKTLFAYYLRVLANPLTPDGEYFRFTPPGLVAAVKSDMSGWGEWSEVTENTRTPLWSNYDVLNEDGTVFLAASNPVPVYE